MPGSKVLRSGWLFTYHALCSIDGCVLAFGAFKILPMSVADDWGSHEAPEFGKVLLVGLHELPVVGTLFTGVACGFHVVVGGCSKGSPAPRVNSRLPEQIREQKLLATLFQSLHEVPSDEP